MNFIVSIAALSTFYVLVAILERVPALRFRVLRSPRPYLSTDLAWYGVAVGATAISVFLFRPQLAKLAVPVVANSVQSLPVPVQVLLALLVFDFVSFCVHRWLHQVDTLWCFHKVHHSSLQLDGFATTRAHMLENFLRFIPAQAALFIVGIPVELVTPTVAVVAAYGITNHSNLDPHLRVVEAILVTPRLHRRHHIPSTTQHNFGAIFTMWDRMFGTLVRRDATPDERFGVPGEVDAYPQRFSTAAREPLRQLRDVLNRRDARRLVDETPTTAGEAAGPEHCDSDTFGPRERRNLLRILEVRGATLAQITAAERAGQLTRLAGELLFLPPGARLTASEVTNQAGITEERLHELWSVAGLAPATPSDRRFTQDDVAWIRTVAAATTLFGDAMTTQLLRVIAFATANIADATVSTFVSTAGASAAADPSPAALVDIDAKAAALLPALVRTVEGLLRQHLVDAARPNVSGDGPSGHETAALTVGFVDLVGSTSFERDLPLAEVGSAIATFEEIAASVVNTHGGRIVKFIGDEVMFTVTEPAVACAIALKIVEQVHDAPVLQNARGGVAFGDVLVRAADRYGPVVNLAARTTKAAAAGTVVVTQQVASTAALGDPDLDFLPLGLHQMHGLTEPVELSRVAIRDTNPAHPVQPRLRSTLRGRTVMT